MASERKVEGFVVVGADPSAGIVGGVLFCDREDADQEAADQNAIASRHAERPDLYRVRRATLTVHEDQEGE